MNQDSLCEDNIFDEVFMKHADSLRSLLYFKCGNWEQAEDWTQEAFLKLWQNCAKVPIEKVWNFIFTVANNLLFNQGKRKGVILKFSRQYTDQKETETPDFLLEEKEFLGKLESAISRLTEGQREVFLLNRIEGKTYKEIAEMLEISIKAVEKRMHKALLSLRKLVKKI